MAKSFNFKASLIFIRYDFPALQIYGVTHVRSNCSSFRSEMLDLNLHNHNQNTYIYTDVFKLTEFYLNKRHIPFKEVTRISNPMYVSVGEPTYVSRKRLPEEM